MREIRFTFVCNEIERQLIASIAKRLNRSQGDALRLLVELAAKELKIGLGDLPSKNNQNMGGE